MAVSIEDFRSAGELPSGPVSAWPKDRNDQLTREANAYRNMGKHDTNVMVGAGRMARNLAKATKQAIVHGKVSEEVRNERYETCKACPHFIEDSKRCSQCGCFMEAKTWIGGNPDELCPKQKWAR